MAIPNQKTLNPVDFEAAVDATVSVITPMFNAITFVERCVAQVIVQGSVVREHIIADGGSTDGTIERLEALATIHPHLRIMYGPDKGQSDAMNKATNAASGKYISILNADDSYEPSALLHMALILSDIQKPTMLVGNCHVIDDAGRSLFWNKPSDLRLESLLLGYNHTPHPVNPSAYMYHREVHDLVNGFDVADHHSMDVEFMYKCAAIVQMRYIDKHWGNFVLAPGTKTFDDKERMSRPKRLQARYIAALGPRSRIKLWWHYICRLPLRIRRKLLNGL